MENILQNKKGLLEEKELGKFQFCLLLDVHLWATYSTGLTLNFLFCKLATINL